MPVIIDGKKLIPAPRATISREFQTQEDGKQLGSVFNITLSGTLSALKGSPDGNGDWWDQPDYPPDVDATEDERLRAILRKQKALSELVSKEGLKLEIQPWDNSQSTRCNPIVRSINFAEGQWFDVCDYTIVFEASVLLLNGKPLGADDGWETSQFVESFVENWSFDVVSFEQGTYSLSHTLTAKGKRVYDENGDLLREPWEQAKEFILLEQQTRLGPNPDRTGVGVTHNNLLGFYDYRRTQQIDETGGTYSLTENWTCLDLGRAPDSEPENLSIQEQFPSTLELNIVVRENEGRVTVSADGTITGLSSWVGGEFILEKSKIENARGRWNSLKDNLNAEILRVSGTTVNEQPSSTQVGFNEVNGTITFSYEYDEAQSEENGGFPGALYTQVTIINRNPTDFYANIPVVQRKRGPILQDPSSRGARVRTINVDMIMEKSDNLEGPDTNDFVVKLFPKKEEVNGRRLFIDSDEESWSRYSRRYTRTVTLTWEHKDLKDNLRDLWSPVGQENTLIGVQQP